MTSKEKLLRSAETLFAAKGFREVTVREIAARAGVNSALVGYYFRGKQALFNEIYRAHTEPLVQERMKRLAAITGNGHKPALEEILRAWVIPWLRVGTDPQHRALHVRFTANLSNERWHHNKKASNLSQQMHAAFVDALQQCLPGLSKETLLWRLHFLMGSITFGLRNPGPLRAYSEGKCDPEDLEMLFAQVLPFAIAGFSAPEPKVEKETTQPGSESAARRKR